MTDSNEKKCRLCGHVAHETILTAQKTPFNESYTLSRCLVCTFVSIVPLPSSQTLEKYYSEQYWHPQKKMHNESVDKLYELRMLPVLKYLQKVVPQGGRVLDWGAGNGAWVYLLRQVGYKVLGVDHYNNEPNDKLLIKGDISAAEFDSNSFDAITCFHVLEHLHDPVESVKDGLKLLKHKGFMIIEVPNIDSWGYAIFRSYWQPLQIPTHLNHFSLETLQKIFVDICHVKIIRTDFFSWRASPASLVLSIFPGLTPKRVRKKYNGRFPTHYKLIYLALQLLSFPVCWVAGKLNKGSILRIIIQKN